MKRNLMTLLLGLLLLFVGSSIAKAEIVNTVPTSAASITENAISVNKMKLSYLTKKCALFDACSNARKAADTALTNAVNTCEADGWASQSCTNAVDRADALSDNATLHCNESTVIMKDTPILPKEKIIKKQENTFS